MAEQELPGGWLPPQAAGRRPGASARRAAADRSARSSSSRAASRAPTAWRSPRSSARSRASACSCSRSACRSCSRSRSASPAGCARRGRPRTSAPASARPARSWHHRGRAERHRRDRLAGADRRRLLARGAPAQPRAGARAAATELVANLNRVTPNPFVKQYLMTAGPTPVPPAVSQAMAAPMLYHRAPAFVELYERVLAKLPNVFQTENDVLAFAASGSGAMESAAANLVRPGTPVLACRRRQVRRALDRARRGLRRRDRPLRARLGRAPRPRRVRPPAGRERRHRGRLRDAERDLDRHRPRRPGDRRGLQAPRRDPRRRRRLRPRRRRAAPGRVGHRRRRRRLPEGADVPARPRLRLGLRSAPPTTPPASPAAATTSTGARTSRPRRKGNRAFTPAVPLFLGLDIALDMILEEGWRTSSPATRCSPAPPAPAPQAIGLDDLRRRRRALRPSSPPSSCPTRSTAARSPAPCASSASPPTAARSSSRAASSGSPTAATSAPSTS